MTQTKKPSKAARNPAARKKAAKPVAATAEVVPYKSTANETTRIVYTPDQIALIKRTIAAGATDDELQLFIRQCERTQLDPFSNQIYCIIPRPKKDGTRQKMRIQVSIDGLRVIAKRSKSYGGQLGPYWCGEDGVWKDVWTGKGHPFAARVGIIHRDFSEPIWAVARFDAYAVKFWDTHSGRMVLGEIWDKMGDTMTAKCSEALGLRKAFPHDMSGLYTTEEMDQAGNPKTIAVVEGPPAAPAAKALENKPAQTLPQPAARTVPVTVEFVPGHKVTIEETKVAPGSAAPVNTAIDPDDNLNFDTAPDWREVVTHYGSKAGSKLGDLAAEDLALLQRHFRAVADKRTGKFNPRDLTLQKALADSRQGVPKNKAA